MHKEEIALQIMLKLIEHNVDDFTKKFRSSPNQTGTVLSKVGEVYNELVNSISPSFDQ